MTSSNMSCNIAMKRLVLVMTSVLLACEGGGAGDRQCAADLDCPAGTHCAESACTRECVVDSDCPSPEGSCDDRGRCVTGADGSPEDPFATDPDYESTQDLGGGDPARQPYGTLLGSYRGVGAYSNYVPCANSPRCWFGTGDGRTVGSYGYEFQCVEYAVRFYAQALGYTGLGGNGDARRWWTGPKTAAGRGLSKFANNNTVRPAPDDLIVFDGGTYGHIAVIREVGPDYVKIIQQNWYHNASDGSRRLAMSTAGGRYTIEPLGSTGQYPVLGWLRRPGGPECSCTDGDGDGHYPVGCSAPACAPRDDCDDTRANRHPGAMDVCGNGIDEDCSGADCAPTCSCPDSDGDGYFASGCADPACAPRTDCNNGDASVHPGAMDVCGNGIDEDCSGADCAPTCSCPDSDGDGYFASGCADPACAPRTDCNNGDASVHPGAMDICGNGIDEDCSGNDCPPAATCGDGICAAGEDPSSCAADCGPAFIDQQRLGRDTNGGCTSTGTGWHPAGGIVYWTFATTCTVPGAFSPEIYAHEYGRWRFRIKKSGRYRVSVKIPPSGAACGFPLSTYTTAASYALVRPGPGQPATPYTVNQQANAGLEATVSPSILLNEGDLALYLYDSVTDLAGCCECSTSKRVMFDYARVSWIGP